jgi:hypothetical protein
MVTLAAQPPPSSENKDALSPLELQRRYNPYDRLWRRKGVGSTPILMMRWGNVVNQDAKVGLIVLGLIALGILLAEESRRTPHQSFDPRFILIMLVIGVI